MKKTETNQSFWFGFKMFYVKNKHKRCKLQKNCHFMRGYQVMSHLRWCWLPCLLSQTSSWLSLTDDGNGSVLQSLMSGVCSGVFLAGSESVEFLSSIPWTGICPSALPFELSTSAWTEQEESDLNFCLSCSHLRLLSEPRNEAVLVKLLSVKTSD